MSEGISDSFRSTQYQQRNKANMMFCPGNKCPHYSNATKYPRKCYYEPQCWRGHLDILMITIKRLMQRKILNPFAAIIMKTKNNTKKSRANSKKAVKRER